MGHRGAGVAGGAVRLGRRRDGGLGAAGMLPVVPAAGPATPAVTASRPVMTPRPVRRTWGWVLTACIRRGNGAALPGRRENLYRGHAAGQDARALATNNRCADKRQSPFAIRRRRSWRGAQRRPGGPARRGGPR